MNNIIRSKLLFFFVLVFFWLACSRKHEKSMPLRIVSLKGAFSETLWEMGLGPNIVGTDVTSSYPAELQSLPKLGHNADISVEGILSLQPTLIIADPDDMRVETVEQLSSSRAELLLIRQEYSPEGAVRMIEQIGNALNKKDVAKSLTLKMSDYLGSLKPIQQKPSVLFIYARGTGSLLAAGEETPMDAMIRLAGGLNVSGGFTGYKAVTAEFLMSADPDVVLLFESGLNSLQGVSGLLDIPGMSHTTAGKNRSFIVMDGAYLSGFGPRLGEAVRELNNKFAALALTVDANDRPQ